MTEREILEKMLYQHEECAEANPGYCEKNYPRLNQEQIDWLRYRLYELIEELVDTDEE